MKLAASCLLIMIVCGIVGCKNSLDGFVVYYDRGYETVYALTFLENNRYVVSTNLYPIPRFEDIDRGMYIKGRKRGLITIVSDTSGEIRVIRLFAEGKRNRFEFVDQPQADDIRERK